VFHFEFLSNLTPLIKGCIEERIQEVDKMLLEGETAVVDLRHIFFKTLSSVTAKSFFGVDIAKHKVRDREYCELFVQVIDDLLLYVYSKEHIMLGMSGYNLGLTAKDREIK
jgi:hypothetical protein